LSFFFLLWFAGSAHKFIQKYFCQVPQTSLSHFDWDFHQFIDYLRTNCFLFVVVVETGSNYVVQLWILLPQPPESCDYSCAPPWWLDGVSLQFWTLIKNIVFHLFKPLFMSLNTFINSSLNLLLLISLSLQRCLLNLIRFFFFFLN
jgi:hypothetical protein